MCAPRRVPSTRSRRTRSIACCCPRMLGRPQHVVMKLSESMEGYRKIKTRCSFGYFFTHHCAMRSGRLALCLLIASSAFSAAFAVPMHHAELAKTHRRIDPGHWGTDFETSLSVHEWSQVSPQTRPSEAPALWATAISDAPVVAFSGARSRDARRTLRPSTT